MISDPAPTAYLKEKRGIHSLWIILLIYALLALVFTAIFGYYALGVRAA